MGAATLINSALVRPLWITLTCRVLTNLAQNINQDWGFGGTGFLWTLWGFWWLDSAVSYAIAFGMLYAMYVSTNHCLLSNILTSIQDHPSRTWVGVLSGSN